LWTVLDGGGAGGLNFSSGASADARNPNMIEFAGKYV